MIGRRLAHYEVLAELGRGGMGVVYQARDPRLDRLVCIKVLPRDKVADPERKQRFVQEARMASALNHPNIITIHDISQDDGFDFIVMEHISGKTLDSFIRESKPPDLEWVLKTGIRIARALEAAHENGIIHRDLKPSNVMISDSGLVKVLDFGLAKLTLPDATDEDASTLAPLTQVGAILGTPSYMSPEQAQGLPVDLRSDIFSLGVLLFEMSTGRKPFQGANPGVLIHEIIFAEAPPLRSIRPELPHAFEQVVARALQKQPEARYSSAGDLAEDLQRIDDGLRTGSLDPSQFSLPPRAESPPPGKTAPWARRVAIGGGLALAAVLGVGLLTDWGSEFTAFRLPSLTAYSLYTQGEVYLAEAYKPGFPDKAIESFQQSLTQDPESAAATTGLAAAYRVKYSQEPDQAWLDQALRYARQAVQLNPHLADSRVILGQIYTDLGQYPEAQAEFTAALTSDPLNVDARREQGWLLWKQGDQAGGEASIREAIQLRPEDWESHLTLGTLLYESARYPEAEQAFAEVVRLAPENVGGFRNLSAARYMQGKLGEAAAALQESLKIRSDDATIYSNLGTLYFFQDLMPQAVKAFEKAVQLDPNDYYLWANLADSYRWTPGQEKQAADAYLRAAQLVNQQIQKKPGDATLWSQAALYAAKGGDLTESSRCLAELEKLAPDDARVNYRAAQAYEIAGRRDQALKALEGALAAGYSKDEVSKDPELTELRRDLRYHRLLVQLEKSEP